MSNPKCAECPHPRSDHNADGCEVTVIVDGWEYICECGLNNYETDDDGSRITTDSERYAELCRRR